jgi:tetratricopeptide (TPR) repeat protein
LKFVFRRVAIGIAAGLFFSSACAVCPANAKEPASESSNADWSAPLRTAQYEFGAGNYPGAIATLRSVVSQDPLSAEAFYWLGRAYYEISDLDNAISHAEKSVALQPRNSVYEQWLGRDYAAKADRDRSYFAARKVKKHFELAVALDPSNISARRDLEEFCIQAPWIVGGSTDEAKAQADAISKIDSVAGHLARAAFDEEALKKFDLAEGEYRQALAARPASPDAYFDAVVFFQHRNNPAEMNSVLDAEAKVSPNDPRLPFYRAEALIIKQTDLRRAEEYIKVFLANSPDRSDWPSHAGAREWLGLAYEMQGEQAEAAKQYRASLQLDPGRMSAKARLEKLEQSSR